MTVPSNNNHRHNRRKFLKNGGLILGGLAYSNLNILNINPGISSVSIRDIKIENGVAIAADNGMVGRFKGSESQDLGKLRSFLPKIRDLLIGKDPLDRDLDGEMLWEAIYPGKARLYAEGIDPLTGEDIANKPRISRHTKTGQVFIAFSTVDIALWDLRARLLGQPAYRIIGDAKRNKIPVYWRPGEATEGIKEACRRAREAFDIGYTYQKWYFTKSAKDGKAGLKENIELVRASEGRIARREPDVRQPQYTLFR